MTVSGSQVSTQIRQRSVVVVESSLPADVALDAWRRRRAAPTPAQSTCTRLAGVVMQALRAPKVRVT